MHASAILEENERLGFAGDPICPHPAYGSIWKHQWNGPQITTEGSIGKSSNDRLPAAPTFVLFRRRLFQYQNWVRFLTEAPHERSWEMWGLSSCNPPKVIARQQQTPQ
jgi:hypothetical protein